MTKVNLDQLILRALFEKPGQYISGSQLAEKGGVSRAAIWKHLDHLQHIGYGIEAQPHHGYRIVDCPDVWCAEEITAKLSLSNTGKIPWKPIIFSETASTNDLVWREAQNGAAEGLVISADKQTKGRGRQGRVWESPKTDGLYSTVLLRPNWPIHQAARITILTSVALVEALEKVCGQKIEIKWPNDLYIKGKKLSGILTETAADPEKILFAVVGFGINVSQDKDDFSKEVREKATSLKIETGVSHRRADLLVSILSCLDKVYSEPFENVRKRWLDRCLTVGKTITVSTTSGKVVGQAVDINSDGALILRKDSGQTEILTAGDVL